MTPRVGPKGQVVIPKALRDELGISSGDDVVFWHEGDHIALAPAASDRPLRGRFRDRPLVKQLEANAATTTGGKPVGDCRTGLLGGVAVPGATLLTLDHRLARSSPVDVEPLP